MEMKDYKRNIVVDIIIMVLLLGLWSLVIHYHQIKVMNAIAGEKKYSFLKWFSLSLLTFGIYSCYFQYKKSEFFCEARGIDDSPEPILALLMSIFGLGGIYDLILQSKINDWVNLKLKAETL